MKNEIFNRYVEDVCTLFEVSKEEFFTKNKRSDLADARHLLYYLCYKRPMLIIYIQDFMKKNGYEISHSTVIYGISKVKKKVRRDPDYIRVVGDLLSND